MQIVAAQLLEDRMEELNTLTCEVKKLGLNPDDMLVITYRDYLTHTQFTRISTYLEEKRQGFPFNNKILLLDGVSSITILGKGDL